MPCTQYNIIIRMKTKRNYVAPVTKKYTLVVSKHLLINSNPPTANFISSPGVGDAESGDQIGTESRKTNYELWDE